MWYVIVIVGRGYTYITTLSRGAPRKEGYILQQQQQYGKERGGGQNFSTSFWMRFSQAPLCRYRFKFIFDDIVFLLSGNILEYICF